MSFGRLVGGELPYRGSLDPSTTGECYELLDNTVSTLRYTISHLTTSPKAFAHVPSCNHLSITI